MVFVWLFMMASVTDMHLDDLKACEQEGMKPKVCRKFDKPEPKKKWW